MKLTRLELRAYGAFTGNVITLRPDAKVHVLIGPNEVGKSTRRAAITDFLYGIPRRSNYSFKHDPAKLCIAASVLARGETYHLLRHKGDKKSLTDHSGTACDPGLLPSLLQGFDRTMYEKLCSISHEELKRGKDILLESQGAAAEALFGAASGGLNIRALLKSFDERIEALYVKSATGKRPLNVAMQEYRLKEEERIRLTVDPEKWYTLNRTVQELDEAIVTAQNGISRVRATIRELETFYDLREQIEAYQQQTLMFTELNSEPLLSEEHFIELHALQQQLDELALKLKACDLPESADQEALQSYLKGDEALIALEPECRGLVQAAVTLNGLRDRASQAQLREQVPDLARQIRAEACTVWGDISLDQACAQCQTLDHERFRQARAELHAYRIADTQAEQCRQDIEKTQIAIAELERLVGNEDPALLLRPLEAILGEIERVGRVDQEIDKLQASITYRLDILQQKLNALAISLENPLDCRGKVVPARAVVERFERDWVAMAREQEATDQQIADVLLSIQTRERALQLNTLPLRLVTAEVLEHIRRDRDELYAGLCDQSGINRPVVAKSYERLVREADRLADERFEQAGPLAALAAHEVEILDQRKKHAQLGAQLIDIQQRQKTWQADWETFASPFMSSTCLPDDFYRYLEGVQECRVLSESICTAQASITELRFTEERLCRDVRVCLNDHAVEYSFGAVLSLARARAQELRDVCADYKANQRDLAKYQKILPTKQQAFPEYVSELQSCAARLQATCAALYLSPTTGLSTVADRVEQISVLTTLVSEYLKRRGELTELNHAEAQFLQDVLETLQDCDPLWQIDFAANDIKAVLSLPKAVREAYDRQALRRQQAREIERVAAERLRIENELGISLARRDAILNAAGVKTSDLRSLLARGEQYQQLLAKHCEVSRHIRLVARDTPEAIVAKIEDLGGWTHIDFEVARLRSDYVAENECFQTLLQQKGVAVLEIEHARNSLAAVEAENQLMTIGADIDRLAREYTALTVARTLLADRAEIYADQNQIPILQEAEGYLQMMTLGRYRGIRIVEGDDAQPTLCVLDESGQAKLILEMSEGTQDQLYLALRLATIGQRLEADAGPPLLLDDTLRAFDDERSVAGFQALGAFARYAQIIYFTPRRAVGELALKALGADAEIMQLSAEEAALTLF